jgi:hypothetical protein
MPDIHSHVSGADKLRKSFMKGLKVLPPDVQLTVLMLARNMTAENKRQMKSKAPEHVLAPYLALAVCCELFEAFEEWQIDRKNDDSNTKHGQSV